MAELNLTPSQKARVAQTCEQVIGMRMNIRDGGEKTYVTGVVVAAEPSHWGDRRLVFKLTMECGVNKTRRDFFTSTFNSAR